MQVHNMKVGKIRNGYKEHVELTEQAKAEGIPLEELKARQIKAEDGDAPTAKPKKGKKKISALAAAKRRFAK